MATSTIILALPLLILAITRGCIGEEQQLTVTQNATDCWTSNNVTQHQEDIKEAVQAFSRNGTWEQWHSLMTDLGALLDNSSDVQGQLQKPSVWGVGYDGYTQLAAILLCAGMPINITDAFGYTLMDGAARGGQLQLVKMLLNNGADVNARGNYGWTDLMWAANFGQLEVVQWLVQSGADTSAKDEDGYTALYWATSENRTAVVQYLEQYPH